MYVSACAPLSPTANHSITCQCASCKERNRLAMDGFAISKSILIAEKEGRYKDAGKLRHSLKIIEEEMARL